MTAVTSFYWPDEYSCGMAPIKMKNGGSRRKGPGDEYMISVEAARFYCKTRYYWTVCRKVKPEELVAWGDAPSKQDAEQAARNEVADLTAGFSGGGHLLPVPQYHHR